MSEDLDIVARENHFNLDLWDRICPSSIDTSKLQALVPVFWSQMCDCVVLAVDYELVMYQVMDNCDWWWKTKVKKYFNFWLCFLCVHYSVHAVKVERNVFWYEHYDGIKL